MNRTPERRRAMVFLVLGIAFQTTGITNPKPSVKYAFIALGSVFLLIAAFRLLRLRKQG